MFNVCNKYVLIVLFVKIYVVFFIDKLINCSWFLLYIYLVLFFVFFDLVLVCLVFFFVFWCLIFDRVLNRFEEYLYSFGLYK